jgi:hypothetical protein
MSPWRKTTLIVEVDRDTDSMTTEECRAIYEAATQAMKGGTSQVVNEVRIVPKQKT